MIWLLAPGGLIHRSLLALMTGRMTMSMMESPVNLNAILKLWEAFKTEAAE